MAWLKVKKEVESPKQRLYLIEMRDESGYYIKCGKSSGENSVARLMSIIESYIIASNCMYSPYAKILRDVEVTDVFKREKEFHTLFKDRRHYPEYEFSGFTEVFSLTKEEAILAFDKIVGVEYSRTELKECFSCKVKKSTMEFHTNKSKKDGLNHECKECTLDRLRSFKALPTRMYSNQIIHSKSRGHPRPQYTSSQFKEWVLSNPKYKELYDKYKESDFDKNLVPSVDRLDPKLPYTFDNIELISFIENLRRNGITQIIEKGDPVLCINKFTGEVVAEFPTKNLAITTLKLSCKDLAKNVDVVLKYGWLSTVGDFQFVSVKNTNKFIDNGWLKEEYRYKVKVDKEKVLEVYNEIVKDDKS